MPTPTLWGSEFRINPAAPGNQDSAQVVALKDGTFAAVWFSLVNGVLALQGQVYDAIGTPKSNVFAVNTTVIALAHSRSASITVLEDGRFAVAWSSFGPDFVQNA
jgi:hypothetical protein